MHCHYWALSEDSFSESAATVPHETRTFLPVRFPVSLRNVSSEPPLQCLCSASPGAPHYSSAKALIHSIVSLRSPHSWLLGKQSL
jgi:hypothetical protein